MIDDDDTETTDDDDAELARHRRTDRGSGTTSFASPVVERWPCASKSGCRNTVEVTDAAVEALASHNRILASRGERPIEKHEAIPCDECARIWNRLQAEACAKRREQISKFVAELRDPQTPAHRIAVAEDYLVKRANDGQSLVRLLAAKRNGVDEAKPARKAKW